MIASESESNITVKKEEAKGNGQMKQAKGVVISNGMQKHQSLMSGTESKNMAESNDIQNAKMATHKVSNKNKDLDMKKDGNDVKLPSHIGGDNSDYSVEDSDEEDQAKKEMQKKF